jgi:hypothetical protein
MNHVYICIRERETERKRGLTFCLVCKLAYHHFLGQILIILVSDSFLPAFLCAFVRIYLLID